MSRAWVPLFLLGGYAVAFGWRALGGGLLVFDDHPGQLYRLVHALTLGLAPWRFDPGWWAGYAELQYYPPGFAWLGALLFHAALGAVEPSAVYRALLWLVWIMPGATTFALLRRALGDPWLALPGTFAALTLSAGCRSGVEEGLRWGLVAARLGWGMLPLLAWRLHPWALGVASAPLATSAALVSAVTLLHPAHAPAAAVLVLLAAWRGEPRGRRLGQAVAILALGVGLAAVWLLPLAVHLDMALPLAWQDLSPAALAARVASEPALVALAVLSGGGWWLARRLPDPGAIWLLGLAPAMAALVALDALVVEPLGLAWLPADRLTDGLSLGLVLGGALGFASLAASSARRPLVALMAVAACLPLALGGVEPGFTLWPGAREWPKEAEVVRGLRMDALWEALRGAPPGRVLFVRSGVKLDWRPEWWRAHTHITALTPLRAGRSIVGGTFTHPSSIAGLIYTGSAANHSITLLAEQRDGVSLFGRPLEALDAQTFDELARRLAVSTVVVSEEDVGRMPFLNDNQTFRRSSRIGAFTLFVSRQPVTEPTRIGPQHWRAETAPAAAGWTELALAYSPLWVARVDGRRVPVRRDGLGLVEVEAPAGTTAVELEHRPGSAEWAGLGLSLLSGTAIIAIGLGQRHA